MSIKNDMLKHRILVNRYATNQSNQLKRQLDKHIKTKVIKQVNKGQTSVRDIRKLERQLLADVKPIIREQIAALQDYYKYESDFSTRLYKKYDIAEDIQKSTITRSDVKTIETTFKTEGQSKKIIDSFEDFTSTKISKLSQILRDAEVNKTETQIVVESVERFFDGLIRVQSKALVLNSVLSTMQEARDDLEVVDKVEWTNALDSNVCTYCEGLDGKDYPIDDAPDCPAHAGCNCELVPI